MKESDEDKLLFLRAHGIFMLFTWILFVSTGIIIARYFKKTWLTKKLCGKPIWFSVHRTVMIFAAIMTLVAFGCILISKRGAWINGNLSLELTHSIIGIFVVIAVAIQLTMALFRCNPNHQYRFIFNYAHRMVGFSTFILSMIAILLATLFTRFDSMLKNYWKILAAWICWTFLEFAIFECLEILHRKYWPPFNELNRTKPLQMNVPHNSNESTPVEDQWLRENILRERLQTLFLILHILVALGISLALAKGIIKIV